MSSFGYNKSHYSGKKSDYSELKPKDTVDDVIAAVDTGMDFL